MRWLSTVAVYALCACGSKDAETPPAPPAPTPPVEVRSTDLGIARLPQPVADLPRQQSFRLLDPGTGERTPLRYAVSDAEVTTQIDMTVTSRRMDGATWGPSTKPPPIRTSLAVASISASQLRARALVGEVVGTATPEALAYLEGWKATENRRMTLGFDARGLLGPVTFSDDPTGARSREAIDDLTQRLLAIVVPIPDEPIGTGASWRVVTILVQHPVVVKQTATYTLLERTAAGWKVGIDLQRIGEEQTITDAALGTDAMVDLVALVRRYKGTVEIMPAHALPTGTLEVESSMHLRMQPRTGPVAEQILEDAGSVVLTQSR